MYIESHQNSTEFTRIGFAFWWLVGYHRVQTWLWVLSCCSSGLPYLLLVLPSYLLDFYPIEGSEIKLSPGAVSILSCYQHSSNVGSSIRNPLPWLIYFLSQCGGPLLGVMTVVVIRWTMSCYRQSGFIYGAANTCSAAGSWDVPCCIGWISTSSGFRCLDLTNQ